MKKLKVLCGIPMLLSFVFAMAQEPADTTRLEEVVVMATKTLVNRNYIPMTVSVVNARQIEESSESALLPVLSEQVPGVFITEKGITGFGVATGAAGSISIRGIGGSPNTQTLVLVNGNPQYMGIMGHPLPDAYVASDVERVEVIRGPASTLYGSNAMGGVINIITRGKKEDGLSANASVMYGSYNTCKVMASAGMKHKRFSVFASFNRDHTDGHRDSSEFTIHNGYVSVDYSLSAHMNLSGSFSLAGFDASDPGKETSIAGESIDILRGMGSLAFENRYENTDGSVRFFYNFGEHNITDGFHSTDVNYGLVAYQTVRVFKGNTLTAGLDYKEYGGLAENEKAMGGQGIVFGDTTVTELAGYIYMQQALAEKLTLNAGFRLDNNSISGSEPVPAAGLTWHPGSLTTIKASVAKGFRNPTIRELYLWNVANEDLKAERMLNVEVGILQNLMKNKLNLELTIYRATGDNLIQVTNVGGVVLNRNTGSFENTGVEFGGSWKASQHLHFRTTYSYIHMDKPILATPVQMLNMGGTYSQGRFSWNLSLQSVVDLYTQTAPEPIKETYTLLHSRLAFEATRFLTLFVKGENLTGTKYQILSGYPMPGVVVMGGVRLHLQ